MTEQNKNVVFLVLDSLRKDRISVYNDEVNFTENLDQISENSIVYEDAVTQAPWSLPSHASMFTGKYPWEHNATQVHSFFDEENNTFISDLKGEGYHTGVITVNNWVTPHKGLASEFDYIENFFKGTNNSIAIKASRLSTKIWDKLGALTKKFLGRQFDRLFRVWGIDTSCKSEETLEKTREYLGSREDDENFFLFVNIMEPHEPYHPPAKYKDKHNVGDKSKIAHRQKDMFTKDVDYEETRRAYDASVDYTDDIVGQIYDSLEENNLREETVVVIVSDHGQALGEEGLFGHNFTVMEPVINTVMMIDDPDSDSKDVDDMVELRKLHELVPYHAGIKDEPEEITTEIVRGGYEFPDNFIGYVPKEKWEKYYRKYRYVKKDGKKMVKTIKENGEEFFNTYDLESGEEIQEDEAMKEEIEKIGDSDVGEQEEESEEIKERLEALGYK